MEILRCAQDDNPNWITVAPPQGLIVLPITVGVVYFHFGLYTVWGFLSAYVCVLALVFRWRYRQGRWKRMRVIEPVPLPLVPPT